jgi:hypothetical protein
MVMDVYVRRAIRSHSKVFTEPNDRACFAGFWPGPKGKSGANAFKRWKGENVLAGTQTRREGLRKFRTRLFDK